MLWLKNRGNRWMVSLLAGLAGAVLLWGASAVKETDGIMAWWGTMYPRFCFAEVEEENELEGDAQEREVKMSFWVVEVLKQLGDA